ncbi:MAG: rod shape-determining protein MreC [Bacteroidales bacterium]|nr:rod shape-determining protein MreC [Bacteroidales bacterium]MDD4602404.1 rod shape-determining protein MreC [Bacteroidales bacterium]
MGNLFDFLRKHYFYFLFLLLESFSLILLVNYNEFQGSSLYTASNTVSGSVNKIFNGISEYFSLRKTNQVLIEELAKLHSRLPETYYKTDTTRHFYNDSIKALAYKYISAKVISNSTNKRNNFLMINKGRLQGLENHMGVIIGNKIVGQIVSVSPHFSWIMSMLNKDSRISGKFKKNNQLVNVEWNGGNYRKGQVKEIPKHVVIMKGDTIITSGNSDIFPEGLLIGTMCDYTISPDENFNHGELLFSTDFNSLGYVEVIIDIMRKEKEDLKASFNMR